MLRNSSMQVGLRMSRQIGITLDAEVEAAIERWRASQTVPPSRSAAVAFLVKVGLSHTLPEFAPRPGEPQLPFDRS